MVETYKPETYGEVWAAVYDDIHAGLGGDLAETAASVLADLAGSGRALELAIGTGRIALPLAAKGVELHGIDASTAMVKKLHAKKGGNAIPVTIGDFKDVNVDGNFSLIFVVFNTFFCLLTQDDQVRCFRNVASHLTDQGVFVIEAFVPDLTRFVQGQAVRADQVEPDLVTLDVSQHDPVTQQVKSQIIEIRETGPKLLPIHLRYAWPSELDLMAQLAGLRLRERWSDWQKAPFTSQSRQHISVYEKA